MVSPCLLEKMLLGCEGNDVLMCEKHLRLKTGSKQVVCFHEIRRARQCYFEGICLDDVEQPVSQRYN